MNDLPEPLTPAECDLRDYEWVPIDIVRLLTSETWMLSSAAAKVAALTLWMKAWHQVPAASLPDNDKMLALLSEAGAAWPKLREHIMRNWLLCSDGRLYHPVVAEKAREAWDLKLERRRRTEAARKAVAERRGGKLNGQSSSPQADDTGAVTESVTDNVTGSNRQYQTRPVPEREDSGSLRSPASAVAVASPDPPDARKRLWDQGIPMLRHMTGLSDSGARTFLGKLLREARDDCAALMGGLIEASDLRPPDPKAWLIAAAKARGAPDESRGERLRRELEAGMGADAAYLHLLQ